MSTMSGGMANIHDPRDTMMTVLPPNDPPPDARPDLAPAIRALDPELEAMASHEVIDDKFSLVVGQLSTQGSTVKRLSEKQRLIEERRAQLLVSASDDTLDSLLAVRRPQSYSIGVLLHREQGLNCYKLARLVLVLPCCRFGLIERPHRDIVSSS